MANRAELKGRVSLDSGAFQARMRRIRRTMRQFSARMKRIGANIAKSFAVVGGALTAVAVKSVSLFARQQKAEKGLAAAITATGESVDAVLPKYTRLAQAIQDTYNQGDELTLEQMKQLQIMGVTSDRMEEAVKALIALKSAGMEGATATRYVALAMQGEYAALGRYIPAIRTANTEQQKAAAFSQFVADGLRQQAEEAKTVTGRWEGLKGRISDAWEEMGRAITESINLEDILFNLGETIKTAGRRFRDWAETGGMANAFLVASLAITNMRENWVRTINSIESSWDKFFVRIRYSSYRIKKAIEAGLTFRSVPIESMEDMPFETVGGDTTTLRREEERRAKIVEDIARESEQKRLADIERFYEKYDELQERRSKRLAEEARLAAENANINRTTTRNVNLGLKIEQDKLDILKAQTEELQKQEPLRGIFGTPGAVGENRIGKPFQMNNVPIGNATPRETVKQLELGRKMLISVEEIVREMRGRKGEPTWP